MKVAKVCRCVCMSVCTHVWLLNLTQIQRCTGALCQHVNSWAHTHIHAGNQRTVWGKVSRVSRWGMDYLGQSCESLSQQHLGQRTHGIFSPVWIESPNEGLGCHYCKNLTPVFYVRYICFYPLLSMYFFVHLCASVPKAGATSQCPGNVLTTRGLQHSCLCL